MRYEAQRSGHVIERLYVQAGTGLVLRREVLDPKGTVMRSVSFMRMSSARTTTSPPTTAPPHRGPEPVNELHAPYRDPASAGDGFRLLGRWSHNNKLAQLLYTDGVLSVSVFEQPGKLDWQVLPQGGANARVANEPARRYALPVGEAWVFERGGVVYTCVGDAPANELRSIARDVSAPAPSRTERFAQLVVEPFRW
jgi:hypothetical protein